MRGGSSPPLGFVISRSRVQLPPPAPVFLNRSTARRFRAFRLVQVTVLFSSGGLGLSALRPHKTFDRFAAEVQWWMAGRVAELSGPPMPTPYLYEHKTSGLPKS